MKRAAFAVTAAFMFLTTPLALTAQPRTTSSVIVATDAQFVAKREKAPKKTKAAKTEKKQKQAAAAQARQAAVTFTDDLGRAVTVASCERVAVLQGSLAAVWLLAGGTVSAATHDAFVEPPALTEAQAAALNSEWHTGAFHAHDAGVFARAAQRVERAGAVDAAQGTAAGNSAQTAAQRATSTDGTTTAATAATTQGITPAATANAGASATDAQAAHSGNAAAIAAVSAPAPAIADVGTMMAPNSELLLAQAPDFVILSANISGHKKLVPLLENAGIPCACFNYETFSQYLHILDIFTRLTARSDLYAEHGTRVEAACNAQVAAALAKRDGAASANAATAAPAAADNARTAASGASANKTPATANSEQTTTNDDNALAAATRAATPATASTAQGASTSPAHTAAGAVSAPTVLLLRAFGTGVGAKGSRDLAAGDLLASLGTRNIADTGTLATGDLSLEAIIDADPDFIFVTTMGTNEAKALAAFQSKLASSPAWGDLAAVKNGRCIVLPRELFHFKPLSTDWLSCYEILTGILYGN